MISALLSDERFRFLIGGGSAALLNWLVRFPLSAFLPYPLALLVAQVVGMAYGFMIYRNWVFSPPGHRSLGTELRDFLIVNAGGAACTIAIALVCEAVLAMLTMPAGMSQAIAHAGGIAAGAVANFLGHKHLTFRS